MSFPGRNIIAGKDYQLENKKYPQKIDFKPKKALWYSLGKEWYNFLVYSGTRSLEDRYLYEIKLKEKIFTTLDRKEENKILIIRTLEDVKTLTEEYGVLKKYKDGTSFTLINYKKMVKDLKIKGLEFRNYKKIKNQLKILDLDKYRWYRMIEVASGCLFDTSIVTIKTMGKLDNYIN